MRAPRGVRVEAQQRQGRRSAKALLLIGLTAVGGFSALTPLEAAAQDLDPPNTFAFGPVGLTRDNQPTFALASDEAGSTFTCQLDANSLIPCGPASYQPPQPLAEGPHTFIAYATDPAGNTDPVGSGMEFTVDRSIAGAHLAGARRQRVSPRHLEVNIELRGQEPLTVRATGVIKVGTRRLPVRGITRHLGGRPSIRPALTATSKVERAVARALDRGDRVAVVVRASLRDEIRNKEVKGRTIVLR